MTSSTGRAAGRMTRPRAELRHCSVCGDTFESVRTGRRWAKTCSTACQLEAVDRLIGALEARRQALVEQLEAEGA